MLCISTTSEGMMRLSGASSVRTPLFFLARARRLTHVIGKEKKKVDKNVAQTKERESSDAVAASGVNTESLKEALQKIREEDSPTTTDEREHYFMSQVGIGEQLATQGKSLKLQLTELH